MAASEVATLNTDIFESDGTLVLSDGDSGVVDGVVDIDNRLVNFIVGSTSYQIKLEDLDFARGLLGVLRVFLLDKTLRVTAINQPQPAYDALMEMEFLDESSVAFKMTIESDRVSGRLVFTFELV